MKITYFFRHPAIGFSIHHVFKPIIDEMKQKNSVSIYEMPQKGSMPWDVIRNTRFTYKRRNRESINHVTGHIHDVLLALPGVKTILTIHDLVFLDNVSNPIKYFYKWLFWLYLPVKIADKVVCISNKTKENVLKHIQTDQLTVIYNPIDPIFEYIPKKFNRDKPVILHIGTGWNKNLKRTTEALRGINCHLRIIGKLKPEQIQLLKQTKTDYSNAFNLTDEEIRKEYIKSDLVNFPSVYEGFGMPIIEGQKTGRVVITSKIEPLIEVSGNAVIFVDPLSVDSLHSAYLQIINNSTQREKLIANGLKNTERFITSKITQQYMDLYQQLAVK